MRLGGSPIDLTKSQMLNPKTFRARLFPDSQQNTANITVTETETKMIKKAKILVFFY